MIGVEVDVLIFSGRFRTGLAYALNLQHGVVISLVNNVFICCSMFAQEMAVLAFTPVLFPLALYPRNLQEI